MTITEYLSAIETTLRSGEATEHSYRPIIHEFLSKWSQNFSSTNNYTITNEPKRIAGNAPDFLVNGRGKFL